jgi:hypothetical protein
MANTFSVTAVADKVSLDAQRKGLASFTVTNTSDQPVRGRGQVAVTPPADPSWFTVVGNVSRPIAAGGTEQYPVQIAMAPAAPAGTYSFRLDAVNEANPDEDTTAGPTVTFEAPAAEAPVKRKFPWWIVILVAVVVVGAVIVVLLVSGGDDKNPASTPLPAGNLIANPGAEEGAAAPSDAQQPPVPRWSTSGNLTQVAYGATGGFPEVTTGGQLNGGHAFFAGGPSNPMSSASQDVNVASAASQIDASQVKVTLSALLGGFGGQEDSATVTAKFLGGGGEAIGDAVTIGPVTDAQRGGKTTLVPAGATRDVPPHTRRIMVTIAATRTGGVYNDGSADNVSLTLAPRG